MNPAQRLLQIYDVLDGIDRTQNLNLATVWAQAFGIAPGTSQTDREVTFGLQALHSQAELVRSLLLAEGVPEDLAGTAADRFDRIGSAAYLHGQWASYHGNLMVADTRLSLQWASWVLRGHDENELTPQEVTELKAELDALQASVEATAMSPFLKAFIARQFDSIRTALRLVTIQGAAPLNEAMRKVAGDFKVSQVRLAKEMEQAPPPVRDRVAEVAAKIDKTAKIADNLTKLKKAADEGVDLFGAISEAVKPYLGNLLSGGGP